MRVSSTPELSPVKGRSGIVHTMNKRILAASLWFFAGWYVGAAITVFLGLPELVGPLPGIAMAAFVATDPMQRLWTPARASDIHS